MWLLNTSTLELCSFADYNTPSYIILSHTWEEEEVSFQDVQQLGASAPDNRVGYVKIKEFCALAASHEFYYAWVDTCCIDKTNSTELLEAINSMFKWYRNAAECYAYLRDVKHSNDSESAFRQSRWFTRGWTLQELIAPPTVLFFDHDWKQVGTKASLCTSIESATGIPSAVLTSGTLTNYSVAQIMSWAAKRKTTRVEDMAYSLLGLFGVSMPMVYGEGEKAFTRLQLEIMKTSTDHSLFAWKGEGNVRGPLARSPAEFVDCGSLGSGRLTFKTPASAYEMTNVGLRITLRVLSKASQQSALVEFAFLNCKEANGRSIGIWLKEVVLEGQATGLYVRTSAGSIYPDRRHLDGGPTSPLQLYLVQPDIHLFNGTEGFGSMHGSEIARLYSEFGTVPEQGATPEQNKTQMTIKISNKPSEKVTSTILGTVRSVDEIAGFGYQLIRALDRFKDKYAAITSLERIIDSVKATTLALDQVKPLLVVDSENEARSGKCELFNEKALGNLQRTADQCLETFWKIEAIALNKTNSELVIQRRLSMFHEEIKNSRGSAALKLNGGLESERLPIPRWYFSIGIKTKLGEYSRQLYHLQTTLILILQVVSLRATRTQPTLDLALGAGGGEGVNNEREGDKEG